MRRTLIALLLLVLIGIYGCNQGSFKSAQSAGSPAPVPSEGRRPAVSGNQLGESVPAVLALPTPGPTVERKLIRNAEMAIVIDVPAEGQRRIETIARSHGGFIVTSELSQQGDGDSAPRTEISVVVRVPADKFAAALEEMRKVGSRVKREKITTQDVTEEYIDLEARIRTKTALEAQLMLIMKQATRVSDALEVQKELAEVRGEIERTEGRRRFLENQVSLSTITVLLQQPASVVSSSASGFLHGLKRAFGEGFDAALEVVLWIIRLVLVLIPIVLLIVLPLRYLWRLRRRPPQKLQKPIPTPEAS